jgi:hypothetical protein
LVRDRLETDLRDDFVDPASRQALGLGEAQQVVEGAAAGVHCFGLEQRADDAQRPAQIPVAPAV